MVVAVAVVMAAMVVAEAQSPDGDLASKIPTREG